MCCPQAVAITARLSALLSMLIHYSYVYTYHQGRRHLGMPPAPACAMEMNASGLAQWALHHGMEFSCSPDRRKTHVCCPEGVAITARLSAL